MLCKSAPSWSKQACLSSISRPRPSPSAKLSPSIETQRGNRRRPFRSSNRLAPSPTIQTRGRNLSPASAKKASSSPFAGQFLKAGCSTLSSRGTHWPRWPEPLNQRSSIWRPPIAFPPISFREECKYWFHNSRQRHFVARRNGGCATRSGQETRSEGWPRSGGRRSMRSCEPTAGKRWISRPDNRSSCRRARRQGAAQSSPSHR